MPYLETHRNSKVREKIQRRRELLLGGKSCERCGFDDPRALQFHHRRGEVKTGNVTEMILWGMDKLLAEVDKCEILCANCHAIEHSSPDWNTGL